jgi:hypothetical protein
MNSYYKSIEIHFNSLHHVVAITVGSSHVQNGISEVVSGRSVMT